MSVQQVLRAATVEDLMALELEELEAHLQRGSVALVAKAKQTVKACKEEVSTMEQERKEEASSMEQQRQTLLEFEPKIRECFASSPVKLNVGGTYFSTSVENLTREPNTFFSAMFSGRWEIKTDPHDKAVFVDRDPAQFGLIVNYMRKRTIDLGDLSSKQLKDLREEVDFYQIASLLELLLPKPTEPLPKLTFAPQVKGHIQLSQGNSCATSVGNSVGYATSLVAFSPSVREVKVRLIKGPNVMFGVAPKSILEEGKAYSNCGWYVYAHNGNLYSQNGDSNKPFKRKINDSSVVTVKMDDKFNISFRVDEEDWGVAFPNVARDYSVPLHLSLGLHAGDAVELL